MMEATSDLFWPSMIFTLLAIVVTAIVMGRNKTFASSKRTSVVMEESVSLQCRDETSQRDIQPAKSPKHETIQHGTDSSSVEQVHCSPAWEEESGIKNALRDYSQSPDAESKPLRYMAGMLRTCQLEKMMTKEELEEEHRVQQEQLAAIFQLLKDKQDTFGEVTETDLQEQLKLYSI